jgi:hypothetical protein
METGESAALGGDLAAQIVSVGMRSEQEHFPLAISRPQEPCMSGFKPGGGVGRTDQINTAGGGHKTTRIRTSSSWWAVADRCGKRRLTARPQIRRLS